MLNIIWVNFFFFFFSSRRRHTRLQGDWSSDVCSSDLDGADAERDEIDGPEGPRQGVLTARFRLGAEDGDRLGGEQGHPHNLRPSPAHAEPIGTGGISTGTSGTLVRAPCPLWAAGQTCRVNLSLW